MTGYAHEPVVRGNALNDGRVLRQDVLYWLTCDVLGMTCIALGRILFR